VAVVTPKGGLAFFAPINVVRGIITGHRNGFQLAPRYLYRRSLDNGIEDKCAAGMPLAIGAVAAVHTHRLSQKLVAHFATGATAPEFLALRLGSLFHVLHVRCGSACGNAILRQQIFKIIIFGFSQMNAFKASEAA
jgi:hypothetical protein